MSQMQLVNLKLTNELKKEIEKKSEKDYLSEGEFVRSSIIKLLLKFEVLPQSAFVDLLRDESRSRMKNRKEAFGRDNEIEALRKTRERIYHDKGSS